ncbi:MAG: potassium channel family protein [Dehalococcoidia bacterium]|nr:potassium channel family protein [Dehalococcoidia bacterium]
MPIIVAVVALVLVFGILWDGFETVVLPRRVTRRLGLTRLFQHVTWAPWSALAKRQPGGPRRENWLSFYGPLSLLMLLAVWAAGLIVGFALLQWALGSQLGGPGGQPDFRDDLYVSGTTFFTLGLGDVVPRSQLARLVTVIEAGTGIGFLALVITYLPVLYQSFSRREVSISMLDEAAGSPPIAVELLRRLAGPGDLLEVGSFLREWERWSAELMETHLSYPVLAYYRSQHENQSWLAALTMILDLCVLVMAGVDGAPALSAQLAFAIARHSAIDLSEVLGIPPRPHGPDRLPPSEMSRVWEALATAGSPLRAGPASDGRVAELRLLYEPFVRSLSDHLLMPLPPWIPPENAGDDWRTSAWGA